MNIRVSRSLLTLGASLFAFSAGLANAGTGHGLPTGPINGGNLPIGLPVDTNSGDLLKEFVTWITTQPNGPGNYSIGVTLASNQKDNTVTYTEGRLQYVAPSKFPQIFNPEWSDAHLVGQGDQFFSSRLYAFPVCDADPNSFQPGPTNPFNPFATDKLGVTIDAATGHVKLTLLGQGGAVTQFDTVADPGAGVIYGFGRGASAGTRAIYTISFSKLFQVIPK